MAVTALEDSREQPQLIFFAQRHGRVETLSRREGSKLAAKPSTLKRERGMEHGHPGCGDCGHPACSSGTSRGALRTARRK